MGLDKETLKKNAAIAEMIVGVNPMDIELDYDRNWNSLIDACKAIGIMEDIPDRYANNILHHLTSFNMNGLFLSVAAVAEWSEWRKNISLSRKPEVEEKK